MVNAETVSDGATSQSQHLPLIIMATIMPLLFSSASPQLKAWNSCNSFENLWRANKCAAEPVT